MTTPYLSILIPNFNNGPSSASDGQRDFLDDLLASLHDTLVDDPTPVEIIIADDGSTDESLATARQWSKKTWQQGGSEIRPFCRLIELEHCGVLSVVANRLTNEAAGEIMVRLDGDIVVHTPNWASELKRAFENAPPRVGVIGPKQLSPDGYIHAAGDWVLHPRGYHHIAQGVNAEAVTRALEVDHVMGCFYSFRRAVWKQVGEYDETILRGQTVDYSLRARMLGWNVWAIPTIEFTHYHSVRLKRANEADADEGLVRTRHRFFEKWGFDRLAPDLDVVAEKYAGTHLLWNARVFGPAQTPLAPVMQQAELMQKTRWGSYQSNEHVQAVVNAQLALVEQTVKALGGDLKTVTQIGCGDGMFCHLLAQRGFTVTGIDRDAPLITLAQSVTRRATYQVGAPKFLHQSDPCRLPADDGSAQLVLLLNVLEAHENPVGLLKEVRRIMRPGSAAVVLATKRPTPLDTDVDRMHFYRPYELKAQLNNTQLFAVEDPKPSELPIGLLQILYPVSARQSTAATGAPTKPVEIFAGAH